MAINKVTGTNKQTIDELKREFLDFKDDAVEQLDGLSQEVENLNGKVYTNPSATDTFSSETNSFTVGLQEDALWNEAYIWLTRSSPADSNIILSVPTQGTPRYNHKGEEQIQQVASQSTIVLSSDYAGSSFMFHIKAEPYLTTLEIYEGQINSFVLLAQKKYRNTSLAQDKYFWKGPLTITGAEGITKATYGFAR